MVFFSPAVAGPRPSKSSADSVFTISDRRCGSNAEASAGGAARAGDSASVTESESSEVAKRVMAHPWRQPVWLRGMLAAPKRKPPPPAGPGRGLRSAWPGCPRPGRRAGSDGSVARLQRHPAERLLADHLDVVRACRRTGDADRLAVAAALGAGVGVAGRGLGAVAGVQADVAAAAVGEDVEHGRALGHLDREQQRVARVAGQATDWHLVLQRRGLRPGVVAR